MMQMLLFPKEIHKRKKKKKKKRKKGVPTQRGRGAWKQCGSSKDPPNRETPFNWTPRARASSMYEAFCIPVLVGCALILASKSRCTSRVAVLPSSTFF
jgi:hypothetical protein